MAQNAPVGHRLVVLALLVALGLVVGATPAAASNPKAVLVAVDDAGHTRWKRAPGDHDLSVVGAFDGLVLTVGIPSCNTAAATIRALDARTGKQKWQRAVAAREGSIPLVAHAGNVVVAATADGLLQAFDGRTGRPRWRSAPLAGGSSYRSLVGVGDRLVVSTEAPGSLPQTTGALDAATGKTLWSLSVAGSWFGVPNPAAAGIAFTATPAGTTIDNSTTTISAYDLETGVQRWRTTVHTRGARALTAAGADLVFGADPLGAPVPTATTTVVALDAATGEARWTLPGVNAYFPPLVLVASGHVFADVDGKIAAVRPADGSVEWAVTDVGTPPFSIVADTKTLAVGTATGPRTSTNAYDVAEGRLRWRRQGLSPAAAGAATFYLSDRLGTSDCNVGA